MSRNLQGTYSYKLSCETRNVDDAVDHKIHVIRASMGRKLWGETFCN
jgi:hypothetical protein